LTNTFHWRGTSYRLPDRRHRTYDTALSINRIDYNAEVRTLKGLRLALVLQQRTEGEWLKLRTVASRRQLELAELFPFAAVQESRKSYRDPRRLDASERVVRDLGRGFYGRIPTYRDSEGHTHYMEWCSSCSEWMRREAFSPKADAASGLHPYCKTCRADKERLRYHERKELARAA